MTSHSRPGLRLRWTQIATAAAGGILLACGVAAFAVFPGRRGFDLILPLTNVLLGLLLVRLGSTQRRGWGRALAIGASLAAAPIVLFYGLILTVHEIGEIVVLRTTDDEATVWETRVAVLDHEGSTWIGADHARQRWLRRLVATPRVELIRNGVARCHVAVVVEDLAIREEVFRRIEEKYLIGRLAAALGQPLFVREASSPQRASAAIRLDPCGADTLRSPAASEAPPDRGQEGAS